MIELNRRACLLAKKIAIAQGQLASLGVITLAQEKVLAEVELLNLLFG